MSTPDPEPVGTFTTPFTLFNGEVLHSKAISVFNPLNSWYYMALGRTETKCNGQCHLNGAYPPSKIETGNPLKVFADWFSW